jgi:hypothetical protein
MENELKKINHTQPFYLPRGSFIIQYAPKHTQVISLLLLYTADSGSHPYLLVDHVQPVLIPHISISIKPINDCEALRQLIHLSH